MEATIIESLFNLPKLVSTFLLCYRNPLDFFCKNGNLFKIFYNCHKKKSTNKTQNINQVPKSDIKKKKKNFSPLLKKKIVDFLPFNIIISIFYIHSYPKTRDNFPKKYKIYIGIGMIYFLNPKPFFDIFNHAFKYYIRLKRLISKFIT